MTNGANSDQNISIGKDYSGFPALVGTVRIFIVITATPDFLICSCMKSHNEITTTSTPSPTPLSLLTYQKQRNYLSSDFFSLQKFNERHAKMRIR